LETTQRKSDKQSTMIKILLSARQKKAQIQCQKQKFKWKFKSCEVERLRQFLLT